MKSLDLTTRFLSRANVLTSHFRSHFGVRMSLDNARLAKIVQEVRGLHGKTHAAKEIREFLRTRLHTDKIGQRSTRLAAEFVLEKIAAQVDGSSDHGEATAAILTALDTDFEAGSWGAPPLLGLERILQAHGLFRASISAALLAEGALSHRVGSLARQKAELLKLMVAIQREDVDLARKIWTQRDSMKEGAVPALRKYLDFWISGMFPDNDLPGDSENWHAGIGRQGGKIVVAGPGEFLRDVPYQKSSFTVARALTPGSKLKLAEPGLPLNWTDLGYASAETTTWILGLPAPQRAATLSSVSAFIYKPSIRHRNQAKMLQEFGYEMVAPIPVLNGKANMVQNIIIDLLRWMPAKIYLHGVTFFLGQSPYRDDQIRFDSRNGLKFSNFGETLSPFSQSANLASHNPAINRILLKNLFREGRIDGDRFSIDALRLSNEHYMESLDRIYGVTRR